MSTSVTAGNTGTQSERVSIYMVYMPYSPRAETIPIRVPEGAFVKDLKELIRADSDLKHHLIHEDLFIYKCTDLSRASKTCYHEAFRWLRAHSEENMDGGDLLDEYFPNGPAPEDNDMIDVLAVSGTIAASRDVLWPLADLRISKATRHRFLQIKQISHFPQPSEGVKSDEEVKIWANESGIVHIHRPSGNYGPHTALFHPALARPKDRLTYLDRIEEPSAKYLEWAHKFLITCTDGLKQEKELEETSKQIINSLINENASWQELLPDGSAKPDARWGWEYSIRMILELKNVDGAGGNATLQALLDYCKFLQLPQSKFLVARSSCPVVLIGIMGTRLEISIAMFTDGIYTDKLLSEDLCIDAWQSDTVLRAGRIFKALSLANAELREFYESFALDEDAEITIDHLYPNPLPREGHVIPHLNYLGKLSHVAKPVNESDRKEVHRERPYALYRAVMVREDNGEEVDVVVKFTVRYHAEAHQILAGKQLAPELYFCIPLVGDMFMVIMDYIDGTPLYLERKEPQGYGKIYSDVETAIRTLHEHDLVFGDLRDTNIIMKPDGGAALVDFDWVGKHQVDRYPASWNKQANSWAPTVDRRALMDKAHDDFLLPKVKNRYAKKKLM